MLDVKEDVKRDGESPSPPLPYTSSFPPSIETTQEPPVDSSDSSQPVSTKSMAGLPFLQALQAPPPVFNVSREQALSTLLPPFGTTAGRLSESNTKSRYRLRWNNLTEWATFPDDVLQYWNTVPPHVKLAGITTDTALFLRWEGVANSLAVFNEAHIQALFTDYVLPCHNSAAVGSARAPLSHDQHSAILVTGQSAPQLAGIADLLMISTNLVPTALFEVKTPWLVTATQINALIEDAVNPVIGGPPRVALASEHPGRLAVEQLYGYMVRNGKRIGILTTMKGWSFLWRDNGGQLRMTRMYGEFQALQNATFGAAAEQYVLPAGFTVMQALYYLSALAEANPTLPETPTNGVAGQVELPLAGSRADAAPRIQNPQQPPPQNPYPGGFYGPQFPPYGGGYIGQALGQSFHVVGGYDEADDCMQYHEGVDYKSLQFEPWKKENCLGYKAFLAKVQSDQSTVVLKIWDAWHFDSEDRDQEAAVYVHLKSLWGKYIPSLRVSTPLEFFHALIIEYVDGAPLSRTNINAKVEAAVLEAFNAIHSLGVIHGDVRNENILVAEGGSRVWIIDFERSFILDDSFDKATSIQSEVDAVKYLFKEVKEAVTITHPCRNVEAQHPIVWGPEIISA